MLAIGSRVPRDLPVPGRELDGVHFAMDYLYVRNRWVARQPQRRRRSRAKDKHVIVIGGGDTGADCVGNSIREGAASVVQLELLPEPPATRPDERTPWPLWPLKFRLSYAMEEAKAAGRGEQDFSVVTTRLRRGNGRVQQAALRAGRSRRRPSGRSRAPRASSTPTSCCWRWASCIPSRRAPSTSCRSRRTRAATSGAPTYATSVEGVFAAGDARRGQSLIVWAINEGRQCARMVDRYLGGLDREPVVVGRRRRRRGPRGPAADRRARPVDQGDAVQLFAKRTAARCAWSRATAVRARCA